MLRTQDLRVGITVDEAVVPVANKVFEIGLVAKKKPLTVPTEYNFTSDLFTDTTNGASNTNAKFVLVLNTDLTGTSTYTADQLTTPDIKSITWSINGSTHVITVVLGTDSGSGDPLPDIVLTPQDAFYKNYNSVDGVVYTNSLDEDDYHLITDKDQFASYVHTDDLPECEGGFSGKSIHLWTVNTGSEVPDIIEDISSKVKTLIFTANISGQLGSVTIDFNGVKVFTIKSDTPWTNAGAVAIANTQCSFVDFEAEGKVLYTFSNLLQDYPILTNQTTIKNNNFTSVFQSRTQRDTLIQNNFSFWMQAIEGSFLWDVYVGGKQVQAKYSYFILEEEVSFVISAWIGLGQNYNDDALLNLKGEVSTKLASLKSDGVIAGYTVTFKSVEDQQASDKIKGIVKGFTIDFNEQYRIVQVNILIKGEI